MTMLLAVALVAAGSAAFRLLPLLVGALQSEPVTRLASYAGLSALVLLAVRGVLGRQPPAGSDPRADAAVAVLAVVVGLLVARRGWPLVGVMAAGLACYTTLAWTVTQLA